MTVNEVLPVKSEGSVKKNKPKKWGSKRYSKIMASKMYKYIKILLIARNYDIKKVVKSGKQESEEIKKKRKRAKAFLTDKELQIALYIIISRFKRPLVKGKSIGKVNQTILYNDFVKFYQSPDDDENEPLKNNEATVSRTLSKLVAIGLIKVEKRPPKSSKNKKNIKTFFVFPKLKSLTAHIMLIEEHAKEL